jgi:hypothetical protein
MQFVVRLWLVAFTTLAVAQSRSLVSEEKAVITVSGVAYTAFGGDVAIDGPWALIPPEGTQFFGDTVATRGGDAAEFDDFVDYQP